MRYMKLFRIPDEALATALLVLLIISPCYFAMSNEVLSTDPYGFDESTEKSDGAVASAAAVGDGGHHDGNESRVTDAVNDTNDAVSSAQYQHYQNRLRDKNRWLFLLQVKMMAARHNPPVVGFPHTVPDADRTIQDGHHITARDEEAASFYFPQCSGPQNFSGAWNDGMNFRLYFKVDAPEAGVRFREPKVISAFLYIKRKSRLVPGNHRASVTSSRSGRQGGGGGVAHAGSGSSGGRGSTLRKRRPTRTTDEGETSAASTRADSGRAATNQMKAVISLLSRPKKIRQGMTTESSVVVKNMTLPRYTNGWLRINLTQIVDDWTKRPNRNFGLQVTVESDGSTERFNPAEYFYGTNCSIGNGQSSVVHLAPLSPEETYAGQTDHVYANATTYPFLEVVTVEGQRPRARHQRDFEPIRTDAR